MNSQQSGDKITCNFTPKIKETYLRFYCSKVYEYYGDNHLFINHEHDKPQGDSLFTKLYLQPDEI